MSIQHVDKKQDLKNYSELVKRQNLDRSFNEKDLIGQTLKAASDFVADFGYILRVIQKNGSPCVLTRDYRLDRINVAIENDEITKVFNIG